MQKIRLWRFILPLLMIAPMLHLGGRSAKAEAPLNVLFITLDDMNRDSVGVFGSKLEGTTPNIDSLAAEGLRFQHGHVTIAICQPTRAVWMTGRYPHNSGALGFNKINKGVPTLPETLKTHGYMTGILGKTEHVVPSRSAAFDYSRGRYEMMNGRSRKSYAEFTAEFFSKVKQSGKPFFLMVNTHDPHRPFDNRKPAKLRTAQAAAAKQNGKKKKNRNRGPYPAPSRIYQPEEVPIPGFLPETPAIREEIAQYYSSVRRADDVVGSVLQELEKAGYKQNTVVMLKSDHGIAVPFAKTNCWRHSTITPWIVRWPGMIKPGVVDAEHVVAGVDFAPTILDLLGIKPMEGMDGRSFLPVLKGKKQDGRDYVYTHINTLSSGKGFPMRSVLGKRYGLIFNAWSDGKTTFRNESMAGLTWKSMVAAGAKDEAVAARVKHYSLRTPLEFYDYSEDPDALNNLIDDPESQQLVKQFKDRLKTLMQKYNDPQLDAYLKTLEK